MVMQRLAVLAMVGVLGLGVTAAPAQAAGDAAAKPGKATARVAVTGDLVEPDGGVVKVNLHATERGDTDRGNGFGSAGSRSLFTGGSAVRVGAGEGTAGRLVADRSLYENLTDGAKRLREAIDQANLLLMQIREKGLQVKVP